LDDLFPQTVVGWCIYIKAKKSKKSKEESKAEDQSKAEEEPKVFCWAKNDGESEMRLLCLQLYESNSEATIFEGSLHKQLEYISGEYGLFEIPEHSIKQEGIIERKIPMPRGGL
jgi:hypothetical protein